MVHDYLWQSLIEPKVVEHHQADGRFLIEYWLNAHKLGYLVASVAQDVVLIHTFLFLTMDGTPEGNQLREQLKLRRPDKELLELDKLQTYVMSDIQHDPELREILTDCGCGHLFRILSEPWPKERCIRGCDEEFRKHLGL